MAKMAPLVGRGWHWLDGRGLQALGAAGIAALAATVLFAAAGLLRSGCESCPGYLLVPSAILTTLGTVAVLGGLAAVGHWIGQLTQHTWLDRVGLELAGMELQEAPDEDRRRRLEVVSEAGSAVAQAQARGRTSLWTGAPVALASLLALPGAAGAFGHHEQATAFLFPLLVLTAVAGLAAAVRGTIVLRSARRIVAPRASRRPDPDAA